MKRILLAILFCAANLCFGGSSQLLLASFVSTRTTYFGNCQSDGSPPGGYATDFFGAIVFYGTPQVSPYADRKAMEFICPGVGPQTLVSMEFFCYQRSAGGHIRMAIYNYASTSSDGATIYDYTLPAVATHSSATSVNAGSSGAPQWFGAAAGLTGTTTLIGGQRYIVATAIDSGNVGYAYTTSTNAITNLSGDFTGGLPDPLTGGGVNNSAAPVIRIKVTGNGANAPTPTQLSYYAKTDYVGGGSDGSPSKPYVHAQDALAARCNATGVFDAYPIYIYCSGATDDTVALTDFSLGQFAPTAAHQFYVIGDRTLPTWDATKYHIYPSDRTNYYGCVNFNVQYVNMDRLQVWLPSDTVGHTNETVYLAYGNFSNGIVRLSGGIGDERYFSSINGITVWNTLMYGMGTGGTQSNCIKNHGVSYFWNCTIIGGGTGDGIDVGDNATANLGNCYIYSAGPTIAVGGTLSFAPQTTVATSDSLSSTSGLLNVTYTTTNFTNVTPGSEDLSLKTGSVLVLGGTSTSGNTPPLNFTTDMTGATLSSPPDIGAIKK